MFDKNDDLSAIQARIDAIRNTLGKVDAVIGAAPLPSSVKAALRKALR